MKMLNRVGFWFATGVAAVAGFVSGINWEGIKDKMEETGVKSQCEGRVQMDACAIDQACRWDFDAKKCVEKK
jgi:hypothetical protein